MTIHMARVAHVLEKAGDVAESHTADVRHGHAVLSGSIRVVYADGSESDTHGPNSLVMIDAGVEHAIKAAVDNTSYLCLLPMSRKE